MTPEFFLKSLLESQSLTPEQELTLIAHKKEITDYILSGFQDRNPTIKYAGSHEKETMIKDSYDLDIVCYFPSTDSRTLKEIREDMSVHLNKKYLMEDKSSAERILSLKSVTAPHSYHIDVVPGRFISDSSDVFLHLSEGEKERLQTNLKTHINYIKSSGCVPVIRIVKIWAKRNGIDVKTFVLELFVVEVLKGFRNKDNLKVSFIKVLEEMKNRFGTIELIDPANTGNIVSRLISSNEKAMAVQIASRSFESLELNNDVSAWKNIFNETEELKTSSSESSSGGFTPEAPWSI